MVPGAMAKTGHDGMRCFFFGGSGKDMSAAMEGLWWRPARWLMHPDVTIVAVRGVWMWARWLMPPGFVVVTVCGVWIIDETRLEKVFVWGCTSSI